MQHFSIAELQTMLKNSELDMPMSTKAGKQALIKFYEITGETNKTLKQPILESLSNINILNWKKHYKKTDDLIIMW